jgi:hypothetical protein
LVEATGTTDGTHISAYAQLRGSDGDRSVTLPFSVRSWTVCRRLCRLFLHPWTLSCSMSCVSTAAQSLHACLWLSICLLLLAFGSAASSQQLFASAGASH